MVLGHENDNFLKQNSPFSQFSGTEIACIQAWKMEEDFVENFISGLLGKQAMASLERYKIEIQILMGIKCYLFC